jgi:hypothetical protein
MTGVLGGDSGIVNLKNISSYFESKDSKREKILPLIQHIKRAGMPNRTSEVEIRSRSVAPKTSSVV